MSTQYNYSIVAVIFTFFLFGFGQTGFSQDAPLSIDKDGKVSISSLDIASEARTGTHPTNIRGLYVTGNSIAAGNGVEFRHFNGSQGIGFGFNSIYATGTNTDQHLNIMPRGNGKVGIGTTQPGVMLDVIGNVRGKVAYFDQIRVGANDPGNYKLRVSGGLRVEESVSIGGAHDFAVDAPNYPAGRFVIKQNGNVGIGNANPSAKLDVNGTFKASGVAVFNNRVGIGTSNTTKGRLVVEGWGDTFNTGPHAAYWLKDNKYKLSSISNNYVPYSIYANYRIAGSEFNAFSDARIKNVIGQSDSKKDLGILRDIEITDYTLIDVVGNGGKQHKKVIAQQLVEIYPQAVTNTITEVVPDIFQKTEMTQGWVELETDLKKGDRVKLITEGGAAIYEVLEAESTRFRVDMDASSTEQAPVFVYGREVDDFHAVDYDAIAMLNVSATQELARQVEQLEQEKAAQANRILALEQQVKEIDDIKTQMARLQALLLVPEKQSDTTASIIVE